MQINYGVKLWDIIFRDNPPSLEGKINVSFTLFILFFIIIFDSVISMLLRHWCKNVTWTFYSSSQADYESGSIIKLYDTLFSLLWIQIQAQIYSLKVFNNKNNN